MIFHWGNSRDDPRPPAVTQPLSGDDATGLRMAASAERPWESPFTPGTLPKGGGSRSQVHPPTQGPLRGGLRTAPQSPPGSPPPPTPLTRTVRVRDAVRGGGLHRWPRVTHGRWGAGVRAAGCWGRAGSRGAGGAQAEAAAVRARSTPTLPALRPARLRDCGACARRDHRGAGGAPAPPPASGLGPRGSAATWHRGAALGDRGKAPPASARLCGAGTAPARPPAASNLFPQTICTASSSGGQQFGNACNMPSLPQTTCSDEGEKKDQVIEP
ncbi:serine/arginine repetitive matrix protein 3-like [Myotis daubentonii]|uniref:serine/arginine repetitive matrix protein 3-like n=1 Tax=Myotis daubentonii TaxID=98922 RepID=UPI0028731EE5|nr:serine/arginine repetitive matrix protein 3-like [Myotis daubentonii]